MSLVWNAMIMEDYAVRIWDIDLSSLWDPFKLKLVKKPYILL